MLGPFESMKRRASEVALTIGCWTMGCWLLGLVPLSAQQPPAPPTAPVQQQAPQQREQPGLEGTEETAKSGPRPRTPYEAYDRGLYDQALQGFVDRQVERPGDPELLLNIGAAHYKMRDYGAAEEAFVKAATAGNDEIREQALYNLGNTAFRQGQLEAAVQRYQAALEIDPDDEDAKFNLEFVRDEIRRRHEEAQKRQQEQGGQQQPQPQSQEEQDSSSQDQQGQQGQQDQQQGEGGDEQQQQGQQEQQDQEQQQQAQGGAQAGDRDGDGLPDETELGGANPTDPDNPDTDADGLRDGEEDRNHNGQVDEGETDPNRADSDGDGTPDGEEQGALGGAQAAAGDQLEGMTAEEAERYLQALEEGRPHNAPARPGRGVRVDKDW